MLTLHYNPEYRLHIECKHLLLKWACHYETEHKHLAYMHQDQMPMYLFIPASQLPCWNECVEDVGALCCAIIRLLPPTLQPWVLISRSNAALLAAP